MRQLASSFRKLAMLGKTVQLLGPFTGLVGPGLSDDVTKSQTKIFNFGPSHIPTGGLQNGKCPLRGHIFAFACTISVTD